MTERVRRARSGSSRPARAPTTTGSAGRCSPSTSPARHRAPRRHRPGAAADGAEGPGGRAGRGGALIRDEMANMVWGVERRCAAADGSGDARRRGRARDARRLPRAARAAPRRPAAPPPAAADPLPGDEHRARELDPVRARARARATTARSSCSARAMPRILDGDPSRRVPRAAAHRRLLRRASTRRRPEPYFVHEEEVPRAGVTGGAGLPAHALARRARCRVVRRRGAASDAARGRAGSPSIGWRIRRRPRAPDSYVGKRTC